MLYPRQKKLDFKKEEKWEYSHKRLSALTMLALEGISDYYYMLAN